jgi:hypothetical protein
MNICSSLKLIQTLYLPYFHFTLRPFNPGKKSTAPVECVAGWVSAPVGRLLEKEYFVFPVEI